MREIKFRAWNTETKKMIDLKAITPLALDPTLLQDGLFIPFSECIVLMQYTGRKDRNGKDSYQDDIIDNGNGPVKIFWNNEHYSWWVGFNTEKEEDSFYCPLADYEGQWEIIGNFYENPELLNAK